MTINASIFYIFVALCLKVLDEYGFGTNDTIYVVTDSGANVKKAMQQLQQEGRYKVEWRACFAHTLQLVVQAALNSRLVSDLSKLLAKSREIVGHFRRSPLASEDLRQTQEQLNLPTHRLQQDCATRWNSQV